MDGLQTEVARLRSRHFYDSEDAIYLSVRHVLYKLPGRRLAELSEFFAGMFSLPGSRGSAQEGYTKDRPVVIDWLYPGDWEYLMDCIFRYENFRERHMMPDDGIDVRSVYSLPSGWSNDDDPEFSSQSQTSLHSTDSSLHSSHASIHSALSASAATDTLVLHIASQLQLDPRVPYEAKGVSPRLRPLLSVLKLADLYLFAAARAQVIPAIRDHPDFHRLKPTDQLSIALKAHAGALLRDPFQKFVRSRRFRASDAGDLAPEAAEVIHATRLDLKLELYHTTYILTNFTRNSILIPGECGRLNPPATWYAQAWSSIKKRIFCRRGEKLRPQRTCEQEWDWMMEHCVLLPFLGGSSAIEVEAAMQFYAARYLCLRCYDNLVKKVVVRRRLSKLQESVEEDGLRDFRKCLNFVQREVTA